jgi:uncharacterized protein (TIGR02453 family)
VQFKGWPPAALEFFEGLEANNTKAYFTAHKSTYERDVKAPMVALMDDLSEEFGPSRMLRPNRDIRFSADKTPYRTSAAAMIGGSGYVSVSPDGLMVGAGYYHMDPGQLHRYRQAVDDPATGSELDGLLGKVQAAKLEVHGTDPLKSAPRGYAKDHPRLELLRYKGLVAMKMWRPAAWLGSAGAKTRILEALRSAAPLTAWLDTHVGGGDQGR